MSNFLPLVKKEYKFQGDTIEVSFNLLSRNQMMSLLPLMPKEQGEELSLESQSALMEVSMEALKDNVKDFTGLKDRNGSAIEFKDAVEQAYFTTLMTEITMDMFNESMVEEEKEKK